MQITKDVLIHDLELSSHPLLDKLEFRFEEWGDYLFYLELLQNCEGLDNETKEKITTYVQLHQYGF